MDAFKKLQVSRQPFNAGDVDIDGYYFKLSDPLSGPEQQELYDHAMETSKHVFKVGMGFSSNEVRFNDNNPNEKVKTMWLLSTLKTETGSPAFTIEKIYGISKIRALAESASIHIPKRASKKLDEVKDEVKETSTAVAVAGPGNLGGDAIDETKLGPEPPADTTKANATDTGKEVADAASKDAKTATAKKDATAKVKKDAPAKKTTPKK